MAQVLAAEAAGGRVSDWEPGQQRSRADWKTWNTGYLAREQDARDRADQIRREYREQMAECPHGPRRRIIGSSGGRMWAGLECPAGKPNCGISYLTASQVFQEWRES